MNDIKVPFLDLAREGRRMLENGLMRDIEAVISSGRFLFGPIAQRLEDRLRGYFDDRPVVLVGSGTDAICLSLRALGIGSGDKVAVPGLSAIPTAVAVKMASAEPVYIDVDDGLTMDPAMLEQAVDRDPGIKAALPVHLFGNPAQIGKIRLICAKKGIMLVEDCAQSFGAKVPAGNPLGTLGAAGALSFFPTKNLGGCGDGGAVVCSDTNMAENIRELRFYGQNGRRLGKRWGMNSRMDEIQCAILLKKLEFLDEDMERRLVLKEKYDAVIRAEMPLVWFPKWREGCMPHLYPVMSPMRQRLVEALAMRGIETAAHYPFHLREAVEMAPGAGCGTEAKQRAEQLISLPFNPWMTDEEADTMLEALAAAAKEVRP